MYTTEYILFMNNTNYRKILVIEKKNIYYLHSGSMFRSNHNNV